MNNEEYNYLLYVRRYSMISNNYELHVYKTKSEDIFHTMGEMLYRSFERIERIDFTKYEELKIKYWEDNGKKVLIWKDRYNKNFDEYD